MRRGIFFMTKKCLCAKMILVARYLWKKRGVCPQLRSWKKGTMLGTVCQLHNKHLKASPAGNLYLAHVHKQPKLLQMETGRRENRVCPHLQLCFFLASKNLESFTVVTMANSPRPSVFTLVSSTTKGFFCIIALRNAHLP